MLVSSVWSRDIATVKSHRSHLKSLGMNAMASVLKLFDVPYSLMFSEALKCLLT